MSFPYLTLDDFTLSHATGRAAGVSSWTENRVTGATTVGQSAGSVSLAQTSVRTRRSEHNRLFLVDDAGREIPVEFQGNMPIRDGHQLRLTYAQRKSSGRSAVAVIHNVTTGEAMVHEMGMRPLLGVGRLAFDLAAMFVLWITVAWLVSVLAPTQGWLTLLAFPGSIWFVITMRSRKLKALFQQILES